jgi:hypothetical protein
MRAPQRKLTVSEVASRSWRWLMGAAMAVGLGFCGTDEDPANLDPPPEIPGVGTSPSVTGPPSDTPAALRAQRRHGN